MSAAAVSLRAPVPLQTEGEAFWDSLAHECERLTQAINALASGGGLEESHQVQWNSGRTIRMTRAALPSTDIFAALSFERWGPVIRVSITGRQMEDLRFYPHEIEMPVARDLDGGTVAVFAEGRSFSPHELACYLAQFMRRSFPDLALPCGSADCA